MNLAESNEVSIGRLLAGLSDKVTDIETMVGGIRRGSASLMECRLD